MSFWTNNPCVPTWTEFFQSYFYSRPAKLIDPRPAAKPIPHRVLNGFTLRRATSEDIQQLPTLWGRWYSTSKSARCVVPLAHIQKCAAAGKWDILVCVKGDGEVIGSLARRWIEGLHMREVRWPKAAVIDYFCIHPAYRNKGIGRSLLSLLHNTTTAAGIVPPHLMMWEGIQLSVPPVSAGLFMYKKCSPVGGLQVEKLQGAAASSGWTVLQRGNQIWSEYDSSAEETSIWSSSRGLVAIWNTFHRSVPEGLLIGIVVGGSIEAEAVDAFSSASGHPFGILLATWPFSLTGWQIDSPYQWISYNTHLGFVNTQFPGLCL
jgi:ribosomal protein S18 acetylase RimI-like enzyme